MLVDLDQHADDIISCKHMCCREGVEKAPKAPKTSSATVASLANSSRLPGRVGKTGQLATATKSIAPVAAKMKQEVEVETVDLASNNMRRYHEKTPPKAFRNLNRLHEKVTTGRTVPVAIKKQPLPDYVKGGEPRDSFFDKDTNARTSSDKLSTEYDAGWMGGLPSPSALLGKPYEKLGPLPEHTSTDYGSSWPDGLPSSSTFIHQNDVATGSYPDQNTCEGLDLPPSANGESEIEAAMVGLSDSVTMQKDSKVPAATSQMSSQADAFQDWPPRPDESTPKLCNGSGVMEKSSGASRLFVSTDSPERVSDLGRKRKAGISDEAEDEFQSGPVRKRRGVGDEGNEARTWKAEMTSVKSGQPGWVNELDPALIAEWQDIVEFI